MFHSYYAHSLADLAHHFCDDLKVDNSSPLQPTWIVVQNNEIKEWLSLQYASRKGIAGNFRFIFPSEFLWMLYRLNKKHVPKVLPGDLNALQWTLFYLFNQNEDLLANIPIYDMENDVASKRFHLCAQLADVFDQYQVYRPEMLLDWLDGKPSTKHKDEKWQAYIWKKLNEYWKQHKATKDIPSRPEAYKELLQWMDDKSNPVTEQIPDNLYVFGLSQVNQPFLTILNKYAHHKEVHFYHRKLDFDFVGEDLTQLLSMWNEPAEDELELSNRLLREFNVDSKVTKADSNSATQFSSIRVHSCHNNRREVEVLKDELLHYLDENTDANARDILILVPDAEEYATVIESVFEGNENEPSLPVSKIFRNQKSTTHTLGLVLDLLHSSFKPSMVLEIVNMEPIQNKFSINDEEVDTIEEWVQQNKIHRGVGASFNAPFSWKKGINQLMAGFVMETDELEVFRGLVPYDGIHTSDDMLLAARFSKLMHLLFSFSEETEKSKTVTEWLNFVEIITKELIVDESKDEASATRIFNIISRLKEQAAYTVNQQEINYSLMKSWFKTQITSNDSASGRFGHGITVSSYIPYRSVPFRFIAMLGLNEGVFPRKAVRPEFDLIYGEPKPGDRLQKRDDTYLFLETLFAAEDHFHISYHGQDQHSDTNKLPSMPAQQLLEVMNKSQIVKLEHPLHPFNTRYFKEGGMLTSYSKENLELSKSIRGDSSAEPAFIDSGLQKLIQENKSEIEIRDLIIFFTNPSKYILSNELNASTRSYYNELKDRESFDLDYLESFKLDGLLFDKLSSGFLDTDIFEYVKTAGLIPDKLKGKKVFGSALEEVSGLHQEIQKVSKAKEREINIEVKISGLTIIGKIKGIYGNALVSSRIGKRKPKYEIEHWLKHLMLLEAGYAIDRSIFISKEKDEVDILEIQSDHISKKTFKSYIEWFAGKSALPDTLVFFPETSKAYAEEWLKKKDKKEALSKAKKAWEPKPNYTFVESNEFSNRVVWRNREPLEMEAFHENALTFWEPFIQAVEGGDHE
ncbi:exodeoxyribonuclease V subunit gamma [Gracilimonas sp.]|uniref:exodeoxyribonuclease V subunit gamma n=1 Tax=Gracilimonas sp. TaxID=1974203 RepID=UPI00287106FC|nr:exodeoxyribonuclease V subunit gamma [Gracilimonas sp.]